jgi:hypothetical protein
MGRADAGKAAGNYLAPFGDKLLQQAYIAIVDGIDFLDTEFANLLAAKELASAAARAAGASSSPEPSGRDVLGALGVLISSAIIFLFLSKFLKRWLLPPQGRGQERLQPEPEELRPAEH